MFSLLDQAWTNLRIARDRRRLTEILARLSDVQLRDIGIERVGIQAYVDDGLPWHARHAYAMPATRTFMQGCG